MHAEITFGISLDRIIAVYKLDDGKPYFTIEVSHLEEVSKRATCMQIQLNEPRDADDWLIAIRSAASRLRLKHGFKPDTSTLEHVANVLERDRDYDPEHFQMFPVVQRASHRTAGRSSSDDLTKLSSTVCYLTIGINKLHLIPLPRSSGRSSSTSLNELDAPLSFGMMTLVSVTLQAADDIFQLIFRAPLQGPFAMHLASAAASEIVLRIHIEFEKSDFNQGKIGFRPNLRQIEWIESKGPCLRVGHYLNEKGPSRIFAALYTIEKVASVGLPVLANQCFSLRVTEIVYSLLGAEVKLHPSTCAGGVNEAVGMTAKTMHVTVASGNTSFTHHNCDLVERFRQQRPEVPIVVGAS